MIACGIIFKRRLDGEDEAMMNDYAFEMNVVWQLFICSEHVQGFFEDDIEFKTNHNHMMARKSKQTKVPAMKAGQKGIPQQLIASSQSSDLVDESARKGNTPLFISPP